MHPILYDPATSPRPHDEPATDSRLSHCTACDTDWLRPTGVPFEPAARCIRCDGWLVPVS